MLELGSHSQGERKGTVKAKKLPKLEEVKEMKDSVENDFEEVSKGTLEGNDNQQVIIDDDSDYSIEEQI